MRTDLKRNLRAELSWRGGRRVESGADAGRVRNISGVGRAVGVPERRVRRYV